MLGPSMEMLQKAPSVVHRRTSLATLPRRGPSPAPLSSCIPTQPLLPAPPVVMSRHNRQVTVAAQQDVSVGFDQEAAGAELGAGDAMARQFAIQCAEIADETKCQDISVLHVAPQISWTSYMVFATVFSKPQLLAALARIERMVDDDHPDRQRQNQPGTSPWECLDYGDVVVHLFTAEQREIYDIEGFYAASEEVDLPWALPAAPTGPAAPAQPTWSKQY